MDLQTVQLIVIPLVLGVLTLCVTWLHNSASISHQRTQRLRDLVQSGEWRTVHPMVLVLDVREAFGIRGNLDTRALRLALEYQDKAFSALKDYLSSRDFVHVAEDGRSFRRSKVPGAVQNYGNWPMYVPLIALLIYWILMALASYLYKLGTTEALWLMPIAAVFILAGIGVARGLRAANSLLKLPPIADVENESDR
ncbi:hypothetical protein IFT37_01990 [Pseudomonas fluorescens]|uniref:hypothetical protein n=1 Tax=Pseudomonas fluorescens TaxID=294 RepID=UPI001783D3FE|nr:hypothetical protein [Pseudomonas fluorescens]MBD8146968.1 hypothetical protein [Pseudomonas fluorescens]MBD8175412.1 hypothetical protein [Pseudomonas fluorescens]MBD8743868.1 hypothetical protein [Pseudomonas fluorescens]MBD8750143.1 hypothetical protein [Pseudomonas fluorescens]MBD8759332.1 hypothetical protein [Pseudomonas fluorescens]